MSIQDMEDLKQQYLDEMKSLINSEYCNEIKINELKGNFNGISIEINKKKKLQQLELVANLSTYPSQHFNSFRCEDDDDEEATIQDEHLDTIPETESDELIKSSVKNLVPSPSESEDFFRYRNDDDSFFDENVPNEVYSNPLFEEEIISTKIDLHHFNVESDLIESLLNQDSSIISSPKIDSLLEDDSLMEEIDLFLTPDDSMPPRIENDDYDSEGDILFFEELLSNNSPSLPENESFHFDVIPSSSCETTG
nr:hypothetical protein [Tanacetum cinerariifolium]